MNTKVNAVPNPLTLVRATLQAVHARTIVLITLACSNLAAAGSTPQGFQTELDAKATTFCSYVNILPKSKWVTLGALIFFLLGIVLMLFGGRGGNVYLLRGLGAIVIIPGAIGLARGFGIAC